MKNILSKSIKEIIEIFKQNNYKCYLVGGCIRNFLIGLPIYEYDLCTNAHPNEVKKLFPKYIDIGEKFGCIKVFYKGEYFEITTLRIDGKYLDFRHANSVIFINSTSIDSLRRDFTMNSLYFDGKKLIDPFNYRKDILNKLIKSIGDANIKFYEDPLRMLRCLRFKSQLNFKIELLTLLSLKKNFNLITNISRDRLTKEMRKILEGSNAISSLKLFNSLKGFKIILNEGVYIKNIDNLFNSINNFHIKLFCILYFHSNIDNIIIHIIKSFKLTKSEIKEITAIFNSLVDFKNTSSYIKNLIYKYDYNLTYLILSIANHYINKYCLRMFFRVKWGYCPIKISHLKYNILVYANIKKNITKHKNYLVTLMHIYPYINDRGILKHLIKTKQE